jgi:hypothetical protein
MPWVPFSNSPGQKFAFCDWDHIVPQATARAKREQLAVIGVLRRYDDWSNIPISLIDPTKETSVTRSCITDRSIVDSGMQTRRVNLRPRLCAFSVIVGFALAALMTLGMLMARIAFWFPPYWPGLWFSWIVIIVCRGEMWPSLVGTTLVVLGNAAFYSWLSYRVVKADMLCRGRLSRILLR